MIAIINTYKYFDEVILQEWNYMHTCRHVYITHVTDSVTIINVICCHFSQTAP